MQRCVTGSTGSGGSAFPEGHGSAEPQAEGEDRSLEDWASQRPRARCLGITRPFRKELRGARGAAVRWGWGALGTREHPRPSTHGRQLQTRARSSERGTEGQAEDRLLRHGVL